jgi:hypothetical protein
MMELKATSVRLDGQASVEHQIDIHVLDLVEAFQNPDITVYEVLQGLKYVLDYRLCDGKIPNLDIELMKRLAEGLLHFTNKKRGNLTNRKPTEESDLAFMLFVSFLVTIPEFRQAVGQYSSSDLRYRLAIHLRCQSKSKEQEKMLAATLLGILTTFPQFNDWKELVVEQEHDQVENLFTEYPDQISKPKLPSTQDLFPPPSIILLTRSLF